MIVLILLAIGIAAAVIVAVAISAKDAKATPPDDLVLLSGAGDFDFNIVGESYRQDEIAAVAGGRTEDGVRLETHADLSPEANNPHDANAVAVSIDGHHVGYLSRADAIQYRTRFGTRKAMCGALIVGGWDRGGRDRGHFGVRLDIDEDWSVI